jgi:hypothetical protein
MNGTRAAFDVMEGLMYGKIQLIGVATAVAMMMAPVAQGADVSGTSAGSSTTGGSLTAPGSLGQTPPVTGAQPNAQGVVTLPNPATRPGVIGSPPGSAGAQIGGGAGTQPGQIGIPSTVNDPAMAPLDPNTSADAIVRERQRREAQIRNQ